MRIQRFYTVHGEDAYARIPLKTVTVGGLDADGGAITVPAAWSYAAVQAWVETGFYQGNIPSQTQPVAEAKVPEWLWRRETLAGQAFGNEKETDCRQVFDRVAGSLTYNGWKNGYFTAAEDAQTFYDELRYLLANGMAVLPGRVMQQAGLAWVYGITVAGSAYGLERGQKLRRVTPAAPNLLPPGEDTIFFQPDDSRFSAWLEGKREQAASELALRWGSLALQEQLDGIYAAAVKGSAAAAVDKARRLGVPDVLIAPVLDRASHQAGRLDIECQPSDSGANAKEHLLVTQLPQDDTLYQALWSYNAPAMLFAQNWQDWDDAAEAGTSAAESAMQASRRGATASRGSLNLHAFVAEHQSGWVFDTVGLTHAAKLLTLALDLVLQTTGYSEETSAQRSQAVRPLALGYHNLAPCLLALGHAYDSDGGRALAAAVTAAIAGSATVMSAELAQQVGAAGDYERQRKSVLRVLRNRRRAAYGETQDYETMARPPAGICLDDCPDLVLLAAARRAWDNAQALAQTSGLRNLQLMAVDRDGAQRALLDAATAGLQPLPALTLDQPEDAEHFSRQMAPGLGAALATLNYNEAEQKMIRGQLIGTRTLRGAPYINHENLMARGLTEAMLQRAEAALATASGLHHAVHPWVLGVALCAEQLGLPVSELDDPHINLLQRLGYAPAEIAAAQAYACGGIPAEQLIGIQARHRAVFACLDATGEGTLAPTALLRMAGAVQPFVSGNVALTVPLPLNSEAGDVAALAQLAQDCGCKSFTMRRAPERFLSRGIEATLVRNVLRQLEGTPDADARFAAPKTGRVNENGLPRAALPARRSTGGEAVDAARLKVRISAAEGKMPEAIN